ATQRVCASAPQHPRPKSALQRAVASPRQRIGRRAGPEGEREQGSRQETLERNDSGGLGGLRIWNLPQIYAHQTL
ncbi:hypothetical protein U0070_025163, partial [Myodes glareolus]